VNFEVITGLIGALKDSSTEVRICSAHQLVKLLSNHSSRITKTQKKNIGTALCESLDDAYNIYGSEYIHDGRYYPHVWDEVWQSLWEVTSIP
jgi:hypothetical protein